MLTATGTERESESERDRQTDRQAERETVERGKKSREIQAVKDREKQNEDKDADRHILNLFDTNNVQLGVDKQSRAGCKHRKFPAHHYSRKLK